MTHSWEFLLRLVSFLRYAHSLVSVLYGFSHQVLGQGISSFQASFDPHVTVSPLSPFTSKMQDSRTYVVHFLPIARVREPERQCQ